MNTTEDVSARQEFWRQLIVILNFAKLVHKEFQVLDYSHVNRLLGQADDFASHPNDGSLSEFAKTWRAYSDQYRSHLEQALFRPPGKLQREVDKVKHSFQYLQANAEQIGISLDLVQETIIFFDGIKDRLTGYAVLVQDVEEVVNTPRVSAIQVDRATLRALMVEAFDDEELHDLCYDLGIDYETLAGPTKPSKVRELIEYFRRRDRLDELVNGSREKRPKVAWDNINTSFQTQLKARTVSLNQDTKYLALDADALIQHLIEIIIEKEGEKK